LEKFGGRDRRKDEGLPGMPPSKPLEVELAPLRRDEQRRVDHSSHGERGSRGCVRVMASTVSRNSESTRGPLASASISVSMVDSGSGAGAMRHTGRPCWVTIMLRPVRRTSSTRAAKRLAASVAVTVRGVVRSGALVTYARRIGNAYLDACTKAPDDRGAVT